ncbi:Rha family transcriptional regulator [Salmonella enterica subsp. enterica serovar Stanleyville]|nr:Rha family transcriptional regulator [Salmonella enterica subsp. enterica serovar Stanleyville]
MNSLTVNNRLSQQPGMYEYRPLRHECRLPNSLVVRNHREHSLTVGDESCRNLTAGFVMEGDFMSMLFAGNQKLSALSICARATRMSVLALCGNSGVILLSVKRRQSDGAIVEVYTKRIWSFFPVACANFFSVVKDGPLTPAARLLSILVIAVAFVPIRSATSAWVRPASLRAASISSSNANSSAMASYSALNAGSSIHLAAISSCVIVGALRLPVMLNLLHSGFCLFAFSYRGFLSLLYKAVQHDDALSCQGAVKNASDAIAAFNPKLKKPITKGAGVRFSEIAAIHLHSFNKVLISGSHTQWKLIHLNPDFLVVVLNSVVHRCKHNKIVMFVQCIDSAIPGRYTVQAPYKAGAGIGVLELLSATNDAPASFLLSQLGYIQIMVGWVGAPKGAPVSDNAGYANPAQFTTSEIGVSGGGVTSKLSEAAIMATVPTLAQPEISVINGQAVTSSLAVADYFTKRHDDVLKKIRALDCSPEFTARNFAVSDYTDASGRKLPCYNITRDGFAFLAMGFTGKRAAQFKEAYINAFNQMEKRCITALSLFDYLRLLRLAGVPGYISHVAVNPATGFSSPEHITAHNRACGFFVCNAPSHLNYGGLGRGAERLAGFCDDRSANPAQVTTSCLAAACGDKSKLITGAVVMTTIPTLDQPELCVIDGKVVTSSLAVADYFHKPHKDVLAKISRLDCSVEFTERNFSLSKYTDVTGRKLPCYHITRNGFAFLAMSFTGKRAARFKEAYIKAFDQMEKQLSTPSVLIDAAHNASVLYSYISSIHQVWLQQLYPMLEKAESPLAVSLHDRINDAAALASLINMTLNRSEVRGRK